MHARVCADSISLVEPQQEIASNWYVAYVKYVGG
jgi:hypothetical protein